MAIVDSTGDALQELRRKVGRPLSVNDVRGRRLRGGECELVCVDEQGRVLPGTRRVRFRPTITDTTHVFML